MKMFDVNRIRSDFPILQKKSRGKPLIYLDNASTTQKPQLVIDAISEFYETSNANVHRGVYELSEKATEGYHRTRVELAEFINAEDWRSIIFTSGTTESLNLVAQSWGRANLKAGDEICITQMEHHSNIVPWQLIAGETGVKIKAIPIHTDGTLDIREIEKLVNPKTKIVSLIHESNVFGTINSLAEIISRAKQVGAITVIDAAQSVPHFPVDIAELDCDFLAFSGHKMLGPTGIGVLYGKPDLLKNMPPFLGGGDMINTVTLEESTWNDIPHKFEAGTPKIAQVAGFGAAIEYLNSVGLSQIVDYERKLMTYALKRFNELPDLKLFGPEKSRGPVFSFNFGSIHPHDLAQFLDQDGIAIRAGHHCAQPVMDRLNISATARASLYFYNTAEEIDQLCESLIKIKSVFA
jgi:cysteine desulfurase/selenocysteine lyase